MSDRRGWTNEEEDLLITILQVIVINGGRGDNGSFRAGTYETIVSRIREKNLGISITSKHVQNKIKRMKEKYSCAYDMLNTSGFGWNEKDQCVIVDSPEILEEYLKKHPSKNYTPNKPFPTYDRLKVVFRRDRATGNNAESTKNARVNMNLENEDIFATEGQTVPDVSNMPPISSLPTDGEGSTRKIKRNDMIDLSKLVQETKNEIHEATDQMKKLVSVISSSTPEMDGIGEELKRMGFGVMDIVHITMYFGDKPTQYRVWKTLDNEIKLEFARATLNANM